MKRFILLLLVVSLIGCAAIKQHKEYIAACLADQECYEAALNQAKSIGNKAGDLASLSPVPSAGPIAKSIASYLSLIILLDIKGKKKKESV